MTDRIETPRTLDVSFPRAQEIAGATVAEHARIGVGTGLPVDYEAESDIARAVGYSPEHQAELERDRAASAALIESCKATGALPFWPTEQHTRGHQSEINQNTTGTAPQPLDFPVAAWEPPTVGGGK